VGVLRGAADGQRAPGLHTCGPCLQDLFCRYRTMRGYYVARKAGWDTHGLPSRSRWKSASASPPSARSKTRWASPNYAGCRRESVLSYVDDWRALTERIGYWVDLDAAYWTFDSSYVESVWWHLSRLFEQGLSMRT